MDLMVSLSPESAEPLHRQLYQALREAILTGRLAAGQRLPSSRAWAVSLGVSRTTSALAYDQLLVEGYLVTRRGDGTYVADALLEPRAPEAEAHAAPRLSAYGRRVARLDTLRAPAPEAAVAFTHYGAAALDEFPAAVWRGLLAKRLRDGALPLGYAADPGGYAPLREAMATYLTRVRGVDCDASRILIVGGSQQALDLVARLFIDPGDPVVVEEPGYLGARHVFASYGARLVPGTVDAEGLVVDALPEAGARLVHLTPSHQFPTGAVLTLARRLALLEWARRTESLLIEDDYDSEHRYGDRPIPALQGLDKHGNVLYVGTFSKVLFPGLRIGYLVVPQALVPLVARAKWLTDRQAPVLEQAVLADFISQGHLARHIRRMRALYAERRAILVAALGAAFGDRVQLLGQPCGMHLMIRLTGVPDDQALQARAADCGVAIAAAAPYYMGPAPGGEFVLGFAHLTGPEIERGIRALARALEA